MLNDQEFKLTSSSGTALTFGGEGSTPYTLNSFAPGAAEWDVAQEGSPYFRAFMFGQDVLRGPVWEWHVTVDALDFDSARSLVEDFSRQWHDEKLKSESGAVQRLTYNLGGRERFVLGRTRSFKRSFDSFDWSGTPDMWLSFQLMSNIFYDATDKSVRISIVPPSSGGIVDPVKDPITTLRRSDPISGVAFNAGTVNTPLSFAIHGPVTKPVVYAQGWRIELDYNVQSDQIVYISTAEGRTGVVDNFGRNLIGKLSYGSRPSAIQMPPGEQTIYYQGNDPTGTSYVFVGWNDAFDSL